MASCNPCTQQDDFDFQPELEAAERLGSPVPMDFDDEAEAAGVDAAGVDALAARSERLSPPPLPEHVAPPPPPPPPALRRTARATAGVPEARFADSKESQRDDHDARRLGSRHDCVRDVSYPEALAQIDELNLQKEAWLHEVKTLIEQADQIVSEMPPQHATAARALQDALIELVGEAELPGLDDADSDDGSDDGEVCEPCEPCEPTQQESVAMAFFQQVADELAWSMPAAPPPSPPLALLRASFNGCAGGLVLTRSELLWVSMGAHFSDAKVRVPIRSIFRVFAICSKSPFGSRADVVISMDERDVNAAFKFECGSQLAAAEMFALEVDTTVTALPRATTSATATANATSNATANATANATTTKAAAPARRQTKQVCAAADLRDKLKQVVKLQRSHTAGSNKEAAAILESLAAGDGKAPSIHTIYKQSEHLCEVALGFGGYAISKRIIEQFLKMPAVRLLLPEVLRQQQQDASDALVAKELMANAKQLFTGIFGVGFRGGRLSDEDRNAFAAASAAILPADLFKKRGRAAAASRLTGLGYRALHRGSDQRRELEDSAMGWRRVSTAGNKDKVDYGPLKEAWHSDLLSTEDNQNKDLVCAYACACTFTYVFTWRLACE